MSRIAILTMLLMLTACSNHSSDVQARYVSVDYLSTAFMFQLCVDEQELSGDEVKGIITTELSKHYTKAVLDKAIFTVHRSPDHFSNAYRVVGTCLDLHNTSRKVEYSAYRLAVVRLMEVLEGRDHYSLRINNTHLVDHGHAKDILAELYAVPPKAFHVTELNHHI